MGMKTKRLLAYIIDMLFIISIIMIISYFFKNNIDTLNLQGKINIANEQFIRKEINFGEYFNSISILNYQINKNNFIIAIIEFLIMILYFIIVPFITNGKTLGKYICRIKIENKKEHIKFKTLIIRSFIINGLLFFILSIIGLFTLKDNFYFIFLTISGFFQILLVIISGFMIIYRKDLKGLQDILSKSEVISMR